MFKPSDRIKRIILFLSLATFFILSSLACGQTSQNDFERTIAAQKTEMFELQEKNEKTDSGETIDEEFTSTLIVPPDIPTNTLSTQAEVFANKDWQITGVYLVQGQQYTILYNSGLWSYDPNSGFTDGNGGDYTCNAVTCCEPLPGSPKGSLVGKIGEKVFFIGKGGEFTSPSMGELYLAINDCSQYGDLDNNEGSIVVSITAGSITIQNEPAPEPTQKLVSPFALKPQPFNYLLEELDEGWNKGIVSLAFENHSSEPFVLSTLGNIEIRDITIETKEGVSYPGELWTFGSVHKRTTLIGWDSFAFIPPGFRFGKVQLPYDSRGYQIRWRSAKAATPIRIAFSNHPELDFDLPSQPEASVSFPFVNPPLETQDITSLAGQNLVNDPTGISITFTDRCGSMNYFRSGDTTFHGDNFDAISLELKAINQDKYEEKSIQITFPFTLFMTNGEIYNQNEIELYDSPKYTDYYFQTGHFSLGPGVEKNVYLGLFQPDTLEFNSIDGIPYEEFVKDMPILVHPTNNSYVIFTTTGCK